MTTTTSRHVCPPDHKHGASSTCYNHHRCRCAACTEARGNTQRAIRRAKAYGRYESSHVPALGAQRRLQALVRQGWSQAKLGKKLGIPPQHVRRILVEDRITRVWHDRIAALFAQLWHQVPPHTRQHDLIAYNRAVRYATARGWPRPLDWDDIDNDAGPARVERANDDVDQSAIELAIAGELVDLTPAERRIAVRRLHADGQNDQEIAALIGCADRTVFRIRHELGLHHNDTVHNPRTATRAA